MIRRKGLAVFALLAFMPASSVPQDKKPLVDPVKLTFPLVEIGSLDIDGHIVGQPRARDGIIYFAAREGYLTAVVAQSRAVLWRFKTDHAVSSSPELAGETALLRDDGGVLYVVGPPGKAILKKRLDAVVTTAIRIIEGGALLGTAAGEVLALDLDGNQVWEYRPSAPDAKITAGPVPVYDREGWGDHILFGRSDGRLMAVSGKGKPTWEFQAGGAIEADPVQAGARIYFGDSDRMFYCLDAGTGKVKWRRRLQGAPLYPAVIRGGSIAVAASNSVVYRLARRGGSILSWEAIPSRMVYELGAAGSLVLVSSASPIITALDLRTGKRAGQVEAPDPLVAGAVWSSPYVVLFVEDEDSGRQRMVFLRSR